MKPVRPIADTVPQPAVCPPHRGAFTLLEVLVALSLSVVLIGSIYAGLNLYFKFSTTGQEDVERALLVRSIFRKIEMDVRSVMYRAADTSASSSSSSSSGGSSSGGSAASAGSGSGGTNSSASGSGSSGGSSSSSSNSSSSSSSSSSADSSTTTAPEDAYKTSNTGLFGSKTALLMHVSKPGHEQRALLLAAQGTQQTRTSDMATVAYYLTGTATGAFQQTTKGHGLARMEGDRLALAMADANSSTALMAACTEIVAPEVVSIQFLYFDGFRWVTAWDSSVMKGMPRAIDIKMELSPIPGRGTTPELYNLTIALPLSKPVDTSLISTTTTN